MEVTSVLKQAVILILLYTTNGFGQIPVSRYSAHGGARPQSNPSSVLGVPQESIVVQNLAAGAYNNPYHDFSLPALIAPESYSTGSNSNGLNVRSSTPSLFTSLVAGFKNTGYFFLSILDLTNADRHDKLRAAADNLNGALDSLSQLFTNMQNSKEKILATISNLPIIGFLLRALEKVGYVLLYIPIQILTSVRNLLRNIFNTKQSQYNGYPVTYRAYS